MVARMQQLTRLTNGDDGHALSAGNAEAWHPQIVKVLTLQLGTSNCPPPRLQEVGNSTVLQNLCRQAHLGQRGPEAELALVGHPNCKGHQAQREHASVCGILRKKTVHLE